MNGPKRVLVVEDDAIVALDMQRCVADCGYDVVGFADNCVEALRLVLEQKPDIVLMDYNLKGNLTGATAARELSNQPIRIIFVSAFLDQVVRDGHDLADAYLTKPVSRNDLAQALVGA